MLRKTLWLLCLTLPLCAQTVEVDGDWAGSLAVAGKTLRLVARLRGNGGTFDSADQHATVPIKSLKIEGREVRLDLGVATFEGKLDTGGRTMSGTFHQGALSLPLTLARSSQPIAHAKRSQDPVRPFPYAEEDVTFEGGGKVRLAGTFTYPKQGGPFAVAVLLTGSGAQDRDETLLGHRPFLVLADYLTRLGFAVLRLDDRGTGQSGGVFAETSYADKAADALAALQFLKTRKEADSARLGFIGHSEGGAIGPMAAAESKDVAFVVMMAGPGLPGMQVLKQQGIDLVRAGGGSEEQVRTQVETQQRLFDIWQHAATPQDAEKQTRAWMGAAADAQVAAMKSPTMRDLMSFDPGPALRKLSCSVLAINGAKDNQVAARQNLPAIGAALAQSNSNDWATAELPGLNHLFQTAQKGTLDEYAAIEETISPVALRTIGDWLSARFLKK